MRGRRDDLRDLADAFDSMVARVEGDVERQRRFVANASHELRTPLAVSGALIEVAQADPDPHVAALLTGLGNANARATDLTQALLLMARLEAKPPETGPVDLSLAAEGAAEDLQVIAGQRGVRLDVDAPPVIVTGDVTLLNQLALNLAQNAIVHDLPEHGRARISTATLDGRGVLRVVNTGHRIDPTLLDVLVEPFQRGVGRTRDGHNGSGLGPASASSIVESLSGTLTPAARPDGGLMVEASFPLAKDARGPGHAPGTRLR